jgi:DNA-binding NarL/FixJ family response regulator
MLSRILVVDDHDAVRDGIRRILASRQDWLVCGEARDGIEAVEKAKELRPDVVLMDISMPRMDGVQAGRIIRHEVPEAEVIVVSQNDATIGSRQAAEIDACGYVSKATLGQDLLPAVESALACRKGGKKPPMRHIEGDFEDELRILQRVGETLASDLDLKRVVQAATDAGRELSGAGFGAFFYNVLDEKGQSYMLYTLSGAAPEDFSKFPMPRNTCVFAPTFNGEGTLRLHDVTVDERYGKNPPYHGMPPSHLPVKSYLAVSVISRSGVVLGGLFYGHPESGVFTERAERLVEGIAKHAAIAIDNARLFDEAKRARAESEAIAERLRLAHQAAQAGSFDWNIKTGSNHWTPELESMYGLAPGTFPGTQTAWEQLVHPEDRESAKRGVEEAMKNGQFEGE